MKKLYILIPSVPERLSNVQKQFEKLDNSTCIIYALTDNRNLSIGQKRNELLNMVPFGEYAMFLDDDDELSTDFFKHWANVPKDVDIITFMQCARIIDMDNDTTCIINFRLNGHNNQILEGGIIERPAWHCCIFKVTGKLKGKFGNSNWGEDDDFQKVLNQVCETEHHIHEVLHHYKQNLLER